MQLSESHRSRYMDSQVLDRIFTVLSDGNRRDICRYMAERPESTASLDELAGSIVSEGRFESTRDDARSAHDRVRILLHHRHLPKLDDAGIVEYHSGRRSVKTDAAFPVADELVRAGSG